MSTASEHRSATAVANAVSHRIRILLADDHAVVRAGLAALIATQPDMEVVGEAEDGEAAVTSFALLRPDVLLLDLQMPKLDGVGAIMRIRERVPNAAIVVLTTFAGDAQAVRALNAGASGYLLKTDLRRALFAGIRKAHAGGSALSSRIANEVSRHANNQLTERERSIVHLVSQGKSNRQIAGTLGLSEETIKGYMKLIFLKLGAADRAHAVTLSVQRGFIALA